MLRFCVVTLLVSGIVLSAVQVQAFDGDRQGFVLNLGAGFGQGTLTASANGLEISMDNTGFVTDLKLGGGITPQTVIYYTNRALFYNLSDQGMDSQNIVQGMSAVGLSYFLAPQAPSFFFSGAVGIGVYSEEDSDSETGPGASLGLGYEFSNNWIIEGTILKSNLGTFDGVDMDFTNAMVTISWLAY